MPSIPLLILRPEPGATATVTAARALELQVVATPLFEIAAREWDAPDPAPFDALMLTSAHTVRLGGPRLAQYHALLTFAVGKATAAAARAAGFAHVAAGGRDAAELLALIAARGHRSVLHLCGEEYRDAAAPGVLLTRIAVYGAAPVDVLPAAIGAALACGPAVAALHSPRAGAVFARLLDAAGLPRANVALAAISAAAAEAAGQGWRAVAVAPMPTDAAVLAEAARLCETLR